MGKLEISQKHERFSAGMLHKLRPGSAVKDHDPSVRLGNPRFIRKAIFEALTEGDYEAVTEIYRAHLRVLNRARGAKAMGVSRQYFYKLLRPSTEPSLPTFVKFMHLLKEEQASRLFAKP